MNAPAPRSKAAPMQDDLVEAVARAMCQCIYADDAVDEYWHYFVDEARAAIPIAAEHFARVAQKMGRQHTAGADRTTVARSIAAAIRAAGSAAPRIG